METTETTEAAESLRHAHGGLARVRESCEAILRTRIDSPASPWRDGVVDALALVQDVARQWSDVEHRLHDRVVYPIVHSDVPMTLTGLGQLMVRADEDPAARDEVLRGMARFADLQRSTLVEIEGLLSDLRAWGRRLDDARQGLVDQIDLARAEKTHLEITIGQIQEQIAQLRADVDRHRQAIQEAHDAEDRGVVETIFGVLLAPVTGGASLILAGIGVASIVEAEGEMSALESTIWQHQHRLEELQRGLSEDDALIAALDALLLAPDMAAQDADAAESAVDALRVATSGLYQGVAQATNVLRSADRVASTALTMYAVARNLWMSTYEIARKIEDGGSTGSDEAR